MFPSQLNKSMRDFERELTNKESALAQRTDSNVKNLIVSRPSPKPRGKKPVGKAVKEGKTSVSETSAKKCISGKQIFVGKPHTTASARVDVLVPCKTKDNGENIIHKEIVENTGATVEITVRTKPKGHVRKRSRSQSRGRKGLPRSRVLSARTNGDDVDLSSEKMCLRHPKDADINHRPWCELLKSRDSAQTSNHKLTTGAVQMNSDFLPCTGKPKPAVVNESGEPTVNFYHEHTSSRLQHNIEIDSNTINRASCIQDCAPATTISSQRSNILLDAACGDADNYGGTWDSDQYPREISSVFTVFDPLRILNFLVRELQGISCKKSVEGSNVKRIVTDMEETLRRLPDRYRCDHCKQLVSSLSPTSKPHETTQTTPVLDTSEVVALREANRLLEARCCHLTADKEKLEKEVIEKKKVVETLESKENEYLQKIYNMTGELTEMKKKNDEQMEMLTNLSKVTFQLNNENKVIGPLREGQSKLSSRLEEVIQSMEKLETELHVVNLERDKFRLLLEDKTKDVQGLKELVKNIQFIVSEQLTNLKNLVQHKKAKDQLDNVIRVVSECSVRMSENEETALSHGEAQSPDRYGTRPHCSSPSSSIVNSSLGISPSWQMISKISNIPDSDDTKAPPLVILAHGSDSNAEEYSLDETVHFDDSREFQSKDHQKFGSLQSINDLTASVQCEPQSVSGVVIPIPSELPTKTISVSVVQGREAESCTNEQKFNELYKMFQDLNRNVLFRPSSPQPFQKHVSDADNSSEWTDYSENA